MLREQHKILRGKKVRRRNDDGEKYGANIAKGGTKMH